MLTQTVSRRLVTAVFVLTFMVGLPLANAASSNLSIESVQYDDSGAVRHIRIVPEALPKVARPLQPKTSASAFMAQHKAMFGVTSEQVDFSPVRERTHWTGDTTVTLQQSYNGVPVFGGEVSLLTDPMGQVIAGLSDVLDETALLDVDPVGATTARITAVEGEQYALDYVQQKYAEASLYVSGEPKLCVYAPELIGNDGVPRLTWQVTIGAFYPDVVRYVCFVNAKNGSIELAFSKLCGALDRVIYDGENNAGTSTEVRAEGELACGIEEADLAYKYCGGIYNFYLNWHGRDSFDNNGATIMATVNFCEDNDDCPWHNAMWDGSELYFGQGYVMDDIVGHEFTHGVTDYESNLVYLNESGAINECFSDIWGELYDLENLSGLDDLIGDPSPTLRWLMGEELPGGANRDMEEPNNFFDPDTYQGTYWYGGYLDNGGVHTNSGVGNKLCSLLIDGGTHNTRDIFAMGVAKIIELFYYAQQNLTSTAKYHDLYYILRDGALYFGWTEAEQDNLELACRAVNIRPNTMAPKNFVAYSEPVWHYVDVSWAAPNDIPGLPIVKYILCARNTWPAPSSIDPAEIIYEGTDLSFKDDDAETLVRGSYRYYTIWAYYGIDKYGDEIFSNSAKTFAVVGEIQPEEFLGEEFDGTANDMNDLDYHVITFIPDPDAHLGYRVCQHPNAGTLPVHDYDNDDATQLDFTDPLMSLNGYSIGLPLGGPFDFFENEPYGISVGAIYVSRQGVITLNTTPAPPGNENLTAFHKLATIAGLYSKLQPTATNVFAEDRGDRMVVTFEKVAGELPDPPEEPVAKQLPPPLPGPEPPAPGDPGGGGTPEPTSNENTFQFELFYNTNVIRLSYANIDTHKGIVGISPGHRPLRFHDSDFISSCEECEDDYDDTTDEATELVEDVLTDGELEFSPDSDFFYFDAERSATYTIEVFHAGHVHPTEPVIDTDGDGNPIYRFMVYDTALKLYGPDGTTMVAANDDQDHTLAPLIEWSCPATGRYFIELTTSQTDPHLKGPYQILLTKAFLSPADHGLTPFEVTFPDPALDALIRSELSIAADDPIYNSDVDDLVDLNGDGLGIADLTGLEYCTNLTELSLASNDISDISPLESLSFLTDLTLRENKIADLTPLRLMINLVYLDISINRVTDLTPLENLHALQVLDASINEISELLPLLEPVSLTDVNVDCNPLSDYAMNITAVYLVEDYGITLSMGTCPPGVDVWVPNLVGLTEAEADVALQAVNLVLGTVTREYNDTVALDDIIRHNPVYNDRVPQGTAVNIVVSNGPIPPGGIPEPEPDPGSVNGTVTNGDGDPVVGATVYDLQSPTHETATTDAAGFYEFTTVIPGFHVIYVQAIGYDDTYESVNVVSNESVTQDFVLQVATPGSGPSGQSEISVPRVVGMGQTAAKNEIEAAGLVLGTVTTQHHATVAAGIVISQNPVNESLVAPGTAVNLVVSLGPDAATEGEGEGEGEGDGGYIVDVDGSGGAPNASDIQWVIMAALGETVPYDCDINGDGEVNAVDIMIVINAALA